MEIRLKVNQYSYSLLRPAKATHMINEQVHQVVINNEQFGLADWQMNNYQVKSGNTLNKNIIRTLKTLTVFEYPSNHFL